MSSRDFYVPFNHKGPRLEITGMCLHEKVNTQLWYVQRMEYDWAIERDELLTHTSQIKLTCYRLREARHTRIRSVQVHLC